LKHRASVTRDGIFGSGNTGVARDRHF
jgi:hypothetical protein